MKKWGDANCQGLDKRPNIGQNLRQFQVGSTPIGSGLSRVPKHSQPGGLYKRRIQTLAGAGHRYPGVRIEGNQL